MSKLTSWVPIVFFSTMLASYFVTKSVMELKKENQSLTEQLSRQNSITENANRTFRIINNVSSINSEERNRSAVDSEKVKTVIKTILVNNDCANTAIPNDALIRMHDYSERIRASGTYSDTGTPNR
ncbi:hypothetical protein ONR67_06990 [Proteus terrae]|uniref:hypothetical protein n=1 Tax=Proteus terrae TaxID=1574161 RepID=UPI00232BF622|nr:hypothetical protein [Proteus terrae]WCG91761.1 hypothetical protein ONR67_06990 [Proteus terrae]